MEERIKIWLAAAVVLVLAGVFVFYLASYREVELTVTHKERVVTQDSSRYLIFAEDEVFQNTDSLVNLKFNSSDVYGLLAEGGTYTCGVMGWRIPILSWYRNIISCN